jgi:hypothetical protein
VKVIDARRDPSQPIWRKWKRCTHGAVVCTLAAPSPRQAWARALPRLSKIADDGMRLAAEHQFHLRGSEMQPAAYESVREQRAQIVPVIAETMEEWRIADLLGRAGVDLERAVRLIDAVGAEAAAQAVAFLDVIDVLLLDDEARGAA